MKTDRTTVLVSTIVALVVVVVAVVAYLGAQHSDARSTRLAQQCIASGGTWIQKTGDCVASLPVSP